MLVLTRKKSESISIGKDVVITITQIGSGKVKLGIVAPAHVRIRRSELANFETQPRVESSGGTDTSKIGAEAETNDSSDAETVNESTVDFTTEYAAEIEDQMRCVHSY